MTTPPNPNYGPTPGSSPQGFATRAEELRWAMLSHAGALACAWFAAGILAPAIILMVYGERSAFLRAHAVESLNFQITTLLLTAISGVVTLVTLGFGGFIVAPLAAIWAVYYLVTVILASLAANRGEGYRYPLTLRLVK